MFKSVFQLSDDPQILLDACSRVLHSNAAFEESFGVIEPDAEWWTVFDAKSSSMLQRVSSGQPQSEVLLERNDGHFEHFLVSRQTFEIESEKVTHIRFRSIEPLVRRQELLEHAMESTAVRIGDQFFEQALRTLTSAFKMHIAFIARLSEDGRSAEMVCFIVGGKVIPNLSYPLKDTPCWSVYADSKIFCVPNRVQQRFPNDQDLVDLKAQSYIGIPIVDKQNQVIGHISLLHTDVVGSPTLPEQHVLKIVAARTEAEFQRVEIENELRRAKVEAESANEYKTRLLANISHELRSPLNAILGFAQLLELESGWGDEERQMILSILSNGDALRCLLNDILEISRIELGKITSECKSTDISALVADVYSSFAQVAESRNVRLIQQTESSIPSIVVAGNRIRQIVANLVDNAIKFTSVGGTVTLRARMIRDRRFVEIQVADTGEGVAPEKLEEIFLPFERGGQSHLPGVGLGLAISKSLSDVLGYELTAASNLGEGSTFTLCVPMVEEVGTPDEVPPKSTTSTDVPQANGLVLVVDDSFSSREIVRRILDRQGLQSEEACNGLEAVERCRQSPIPNLVIMDIRMPIMDGIEATRMIRRELMSDCPPILGLTGNLLDPSGDKLDGECFDCVLTKPFKLDDLLKMIRDHLTVSNDSM